MLRHQFDDPIDEHAQFGTDMPIRRERQVKRHFIEPPVFQQWQQLAVGQVRSDHVLRQPDDA